MDWKARIAKAKADIENVEPVAVDVEVGGEITALTFLPVLGEKWDDLVAENPPRKGATLDQNVGYNTDAVAKSYPVEMVTVDGDTPSVDDWRDLLHVLSSPNRRNIASVLFGMNQLEPANRLRDAAGKASAGRSKRKSA